MLESFGKSSLGPDPLRRYYEWVRGVAMREKPGVFRLASVAIASVLGFVIAVAVLLALWGTMAPV